MNVVIIMSKFRTVDIFSNSLVDRGEIQLNDNVLGV